MMLGDILRPEAVTVSLGSKNKDDILSELVDLLVASGGIKKPEKKQILDKLKEREVLGSTGIGKGVGIPHAKCPKIKKMAAAMGISKEGVDFNSLDGELTYIFFLLVAPCEAPGTHLKVLAKISRLLDDKFVRERLRFVSTSQEVLKVLWEEAQKNQQ